MSAPTRLNTKDAAARTGYSEVTIRLYEKDGRFPKAERDSYGHLSWSVAEVVGWINEKEARQERQGQR